jgi:hypothetical protein
METRFNRHHCDLAWTDFGSNHAIHKKVESKWEPPVVEPRWRRTQNSYERTFPHRGKA